LCVHSPFGLRHHDVAQAICLHIEHAQLEPGSDQISNARRELILVGQESDEHTDAHPAVDHGFRPQNDHGEAVGAEQQVVGTVENQIQPLQSQPRIDAVHQVVYPRRATPPFQA